MLGFRVRGLADVYILRFEAGGRGPSVRVWGAGLGVWGFFRVRGLADVYILRFEAGGRGHRVRVWGAGLGVWSF